VEEKRGEESSLGRASWAKQGTLLALDFSP